MDKRTLRHHLHNPYHTAAGIALIGQWALYLLRKIMRRTWKPALKTIAVLALLHLTALLITEAMLNKQLSSVASVINPPVPKLISKSDNAAPLYRQSIQQIHGYISPLHALTYNTDKAITNEEWAEAAKYVNENAGAIALAKIAAQKPECSFGVLSRNDTSCLRTKLSSLSDLLFMTSALRAREQRASESAQAFVLACQTAWANQNLAPYSELEFRIAARAHSLIPRLTQLTRFNNRQLSQMCDALSDVIGSDYTDKLLSSELISMTDSYDRLKQYSISGAFTDYSDNSERPFIIERIKGWLQTPYLNFNEIAAIKVFAANQHLAHLSTRDLWKQRYRPHSPTISGRVRKSAYIARSIISFDLARIAQKRDAAFVHTAGSEIFLAIIAYRNQIGHYPKSLEEVRATLKWSIPQDPFSGRDFVYKRTGDGFLLYSVGYDFRNDGGKRIRKNGYWEEHDIAWRCGNWWSEN